MKAMASAPSYQIPTLEKLVSAGLSHQRKNVTDGLRYFQSLKNYAIDRIRTIAENLSSSYLPTL